MEHLTPRQTFDFLKANPDSLFIDCRSDAEYFFVGHAIGSMHVAWYDAPDWERNPDFEADVRKLAGHAMDRPVVLICRSGKRSVEAGQALEQAGFQRVVNVLHGFEGDLDANRRRGLINGWRFEGLPWEQF